MTSYKPAPIDTSKVTLPVEVQDLIELLARNVHDTWAKHRMGQGWRYGPHRDDARKEHPCLVPYEQLPDTEKEYDRNTAQETLKVILGLGYRIHKG